MGITFFEDIKSRIEKAFSDFLGINSGTELRQVTIALTQIKIHTLYDLVELKVQIEQNFKAAKIMLKQILKLFGYSDFYKSATAKDQESLVQPFYHSKTNLSDNLRTQIIQKGTGNKLIDRIIAYADEFSLLNIS